MEAGIHPYVSIELFAELFKAEEQGIYLKNELHITYILSNLIPATFEIPWDVYERLYEKLDPRCLDVAHFVGISKEFISKNGRRWCHGEKAIPNIYAIHEQLLSQTIAFHSLADQYLWLSHTQFFIALLLLDIYNGAKIQYITKKYAISSWVVRSLQNCIAQASGILSTFIEKLGGSWLAFSKVFHLLSLKLKEIFLVSPDIRELCELDSINTRHARVLSAKGFNSIADIACLTDRDIYNMLSPLYRYEFPSNADEQYFLKLQNMHRLKLAQRIVKEAKAYAAEANYRLEEDIYFEKQRVALARGATEIRVPSVSSHSDKTEEQQRDPPSITFHMFDNAIQHSAEISSDSGDDTTSDAESGTDMDLYQNVKQIENNFIYSQSY